MSEQKKINLSIAENSHAFLNEAVDKALQAGDDIRHWQFAILHLVQSLELSLKSLLKEISEILVFENIDNPRNMVGVTKAIQRLEQPMIKGIKFDVDEKNKIIKSIELRNKITHSDFEFTEIYAEKKYFELFAFLVHFQSRYLHVEIEDIIPQKKLASLILIERSREELLKKALNRIIEEGISTEFILECPICTEDTFVIKDEIDTCYLCRHTESIEECYHCKDLWFEWQLECFGENIDYQYEEGRNVLYNSYGYSNFYACPNCLPIILEEIQQKKDSEEDEYHWMMEHNRA